MHDVSAGGLITALLEMQFGNTKGGFNFYTDGFAMYGETDIVKILFAENPAIIVQIEDNSRRRAEKHLDASGVKYFPIGAPTHEDVLTVSHNEKAFLISVPRARRTWYRTSYLFDRLQSAGNCADERFENFDKQPVTFLYPSNFDGSLASRMLSTRRNKKTGTRAAIIRDKGINGEREMAYSLYLAGFDVKDVHMTDLMSGRETLDDVNMIVFCGGFSNSDVLGSAKGWASGFLFIETANATLRRFYDREDTLSLGVCNGCQLMVELGVLEGFPAKRKISMGHNLSHKFESEFVSLTIPKSHSVMFGPLAGVKAGIWVAHGEGRFVLENGKVPAGTEIAAQYTHNAYPGNPNGSPMGIAAMCTEDGRHVAIMPHLERAIFPWQCAVYPRKRRFDEVTVWIDAFINARKWIESTLKGKTPRLRKVKMHR